MNNEQSTEVRLALLEQKSKSQDREIVELKKDLDQLKSRSWGILISALTAAVSIIFFVFKSAWEKIGS